MLHYPVDFPADAARKIYENYNNGTLASNKEVVVECAWNLVGYGLKVGVGETDEKLMTSAGPQILDLNTGPEGEIDDADMIARLQTYDTTPHEKRVVGALPIPAGLLVKWAIRFALQILNNQFPSK